MNILSINKRQGFTLMELILVIVLIGILVITIGPFVGNTLSSLFKIRQLSKRERQATTALERFVRDVRQSRNSTVNSTVYGENTILKLTRNDATLEYKIHDGVLDFCKYTGFSCNSTREILARNVDDSSKFEKLSNGYDIIVLRLNLNLDQGSTMEFSSLAVPR